MRVSTNARPPLRVPTRKHAGSECPFACARMPKHFLRTVMYRPWQNSCRPAHARIGSGSVLASARLCLPTSAGGFLLTRRMVGGRRGRPSIDSAERSCGYYQCSSSRVGASDALIGVFSGPEDLFTAASTQRSCTCNCKFMQLYDSKCVV